MKKNFVPSVIAGIIMIAFSGCLATGKKISDEKFSSGKGKNIGRKKTEKKMKNLTYPRDVIIAPATTYRNRGKLDFNSVKSEFFNETERFNPNFNSESYDRIYENVFLDAKKNPLSTFSIDVDTASYANIRRFLKSGKLPPRDAIRIEEMINYFSYEYPAPKSSKPFSVSLETSSCPWNKNNKLILIGIQGKKISKQGVPPRNLVFLIDVSGSMTSYNKLPLLKKSFKLLVKQLNREDRVSIVVYAGAAGMVLPPTRGDNHSKILAAIERLRAGGSTNGGQGIQLAYKLAKENFNKEGENRVILASDGDFNVGMTSRGELIRLIEKKRQGGIFLSVLGFGMGNYKDATMEKLADKGNGNYAYIDTFSEAKKVLVNEINATLVTIASDVKIQVEFNPKLIKQYRLIGYENRVLKNRDFNDDKKDAGEIGAGHSITALYEVVPRGAPGVNIPKIDPLKYQGERKITSAGKGLELLTVKVRYKKPSANKSILLSFVLKDEGSRFQAASGNLKFSASVALFGMLLRDSKYYEKSDFDTVWKLAKSSIGKDNFGYRAEFLRLVRLAQSLKKSS